MCWTLAPCAIVFNTPASDDVDLAAHHRRHANVMQKYDKYFIREGDDKYSQRCSMSAFLRLLERKLQPTSTMVVLKTFALLATLFGTVQSSCSRTNYLTARELSSYRYVSYSSSDFCTFNINPSSSLSGSYFLQITWLSFNVKGNMPDCSKDDYVQVYLTRYKVYFQLLYIN